MPRLLDGEVDDREGRIVSLERELGALKGQLAVAQLEAKNARSESAAAVSELRRQLGPLYRTLQMVFGELDAIGGEQDRSYASASTTGTDPRVATVWQAWKARLSPSCGKVIDALLIHGNLNTSQIAVAAGMSKNTVPGVIFQLTRAGLINKNGGRFSLKEL